MGNFSLCQIGDVVRFTFLVGIVLLSGANFDFAFAVTVTVTKQAPIESLSPDGEVTGVSEVAPGTHYVLVRSAAGQLTVKDANGRYRIAIASTDYVPPPAKPVLSPAAQARVNPSPVPVSSSPPVLAPAPAGDADPVTQDRIDELNAGFGKRLFSQAPFWQESALMIAQRLGLGLEGQTKWKTSYRRYFSGNASDPNSALLGGGAYCIALYADADDHPTSLLVAFANEGDYKNVTYVSMDIYGIDHPLSGAPRYLPGKDRVELSKEYADDVKSFEPTRKAEAATLIKNLISLFGRPKNSTFGGDAELRENIQRWDWNGVSFLFSCLPNKYNLLRIVPTALADKNGRCERIPRDEIGAKLASAVEHRPNGDVVITQIPMADQGRLPPVARSRTSSMSSCSCRRIARSITISARWPACVDLTMPRV